MSQISQEQVSDNVVRKIQLLLKLAERKEGNEAEADAAMARAQEILTKYNLDLATVQDKVVEGGTNTPDDAMAKRDYARISRSAMYTWQRNLVRTLAQSNYCHYWVEETTEFRWKRDCKVKRHKLLGRIANTTAVLVMTDYLIETIERLLPYKGKERLSRSAVSWREGCADRLIERIKDRAEKMKKADYATQGEAAYSTAIAVRNMSQAEEIGNYDHRHGAGAWARNQEWEEKWKAGAEQRRLEREAREAKELAELEAKLALETPAQKAARERKERIQAEKDARKDARWWDAYYRRNARAAARVDSAAYYSGRDTGASIGLDGQVGAGKKPSRLS